MGTSIVLNDVVFKNSNLPAIAEFIKDGLVAAFRPTISGDSLVDLSGNSTPATLIGNPKFFDGFMRGYHQNGFRIEAPESESCTLIVVARAGYSTERSNGVCLPLSSRWDVASAQRGCSVFLSPTSTGAYYYANNQAWLKSKTSDAMTTKLGAPVINIGNLSSTVDTTKTNWVFVAVTFNAATNEIIQYVPVSDFEAPVINSDATIAGRRTTNPTNGQMNRFEVCSSSGYAPANGECDVAEALVFNKVLTREQILEQYALSKEFFKKNRLIAI